MCVAAHVCLIRQDAGYTGAKEKAAKESAKAIPTDYFIYLSWTDEMKMRM